jgi:hypothetical protein
MRKIYALLTLVGATLIGAGSCEAQVFFNTTVGSEFTPGVFGQINVNNAPPPPVFYPQPVVGGQEVYGAPPMYVYAPIEETQNWGYFCGKYRACGIPVYFILYDDRHPYWAGYHQTYRVPFRGGYRMDERREPMREERRESLREGRREPFREERRDENRGERHDFRH